MLPCEKNKKREKTTIGGGRREKHRERERQEDKPVWQVCVTVLTPSFKADGKRRETSYCIGDDVITEHCLHYEAVSTQGSWTGTQVTPGEGKAHVFVNF